MSIEVICPLPWMHLFVNKRGNHCLCCISHDHDNKLYDEFGLSIKAPNSLSIAEIFNSPTLKEVRKSFLEGKWPTLCSRCQREEVDGVVSRARIERDYRKDLIPELMRNTLSDGSLKQVFLKEMDLRLGNKCNCACRMCSPHNSLKCLEYWNEVTPEKQHLTPQEAHSLFFMNWFESDEFVSSFKNKISFLEQINFAGGEPLVSSKMVEFLEMIIRDGYASSITLSYNTNFVDVPEKLWSLWGKFKRVKFKVSIDAVGSLNEYIRIGSSWEKIVNNLDQLHHFCGTFPQTEVMIFSVVLAYNVHALRDFVPFLKKYPRFVSLPQLTVLYKPSHLKVSVLPWAIRSELKIQMGEFYKETESLLPPNYEYLRTHISDVLRALDEDDTHLFDDFKSYTEKLDHLYSFSTEYYLPFLKAYL